MVRITHPFHPRAGAEIEVTAVHKWGLRHVAFYRDDQQRLCRIPVQWTSLAPLEPCVMLSQGRSFFRLDDLVRLSEQVERLTPREAEARPSRRID